MSEMKKDFESSKRNNLHINKSLPKASSIFLQKKTFKGRSVCVEGGGGGARGMVYSKY